MSANGHGARTFVVGAGMTTFEKPGAREQCSSTGIPPTGLEPVLQA